MDALQYLKSARLAPNGELLDRTEKLALILLALDLNPDEAQAQPDIDRLSEACLVNRRSMFRILDALERKRALRAYPQKTPSGQSAPTKYELLDAQGRVLPATPYP
jgi:MoxR-like ATPase